MKKWFLLLHWFIFFGCAHYFEKENRTINESNVVKGESICIRSGGALRDSLALGAEHERFGKIYDLIQSKYGIKMKCDETTDLKLVILDESREEWGDWWKISLGIIPGVYSKMWALQLFDANDQIVWHKQTSGKVIVSIFFAPLFFLHTEPDKLIFNELDLYLKEHFKKQL